MPSREPVTEITGVLLLPIEMQMLVVSERPMIDSAALPQKRADGPNPSCTEIARQSLPAPEEHRAFPSATSGRWIVVSLAGYALGSASLALLGWFAHLPRLTDWLGSGIAVFPNTATAAICISLAVLMIGAAQTSPGQKRNPAHWFMLAGRTLGTVGGLIGGITLLEHLTGLDLGVDRLLWDPEWGHRAATSLGRIGPPACTAFILLGITIWLVTGSQNSRHAAPILAIIVLVISALGIIGYIFHADPLFATARFTGIAFPTATMTAALALALLASVPDAEPVATLRQRSAAGALARRSLVFAVLVPVILGWLFVKGRDLGWFDLGMGAALLSLTLIALLCGLLWWCVRDVKYAQQRVASVQENLAEQVMGLTHLHELTTGLMASQDTRSMLHSLLEAIVELHGAQGGILSLTGENGEFIHVGASVNFSDTVLQQLKRMPAGDSACGKAFTERRRVIVRDVETDSQFERFRDIARQAGFRAAHNTPIMSRDGRALGVLSVHFSMPHSPTPVQMQLADICARQAADYLEHARVYEAVATLASVVENSDDAIITKSLDGIITTWNKGAQRIFGYTAAEAVGMPVLILIPEDRQHEEPAILARLRRGERIDHYETVRRRKDGVLLDISLTISPVRNQRGEIVGASKIARDITELRRAREALEESHQELEMKVMERTSSLREAIAQMEEFSYSVSHDLRAPVRAMQGYAKAVLEDYGERIGDDGRNYLERIMRSGERMDRLVRDILTYSRVARSDLTFRPVALDILVEDIINQYPEMQPPRAQITVDPKLGIVMAHEPSLGQAISNLLNNAVKFVAVGAPPRVRVYSEDRGEWVRLWVQDNGIGIRPEHQARLFGLFQRVHPDKRYEGTGIGLAVVRKSVERMGGRVGMESNGAGSRFWIELKRAQ
jgi:PAS domain S-box-containing protein